MRHYEAEQVRQYREGPVHVNSEIAGLIIATITQLQRELQTTKDGLQTAKDYAFDAKVQQRWAEGEITELQQKLLEAKRHILKAQESTQQYERQYHEALVQLKQSRPENQEVSDRTTKVHIKSLEQQLNEAWPGSLGYLPRCSAHTATPARPQVGG